MLSNEALLRKLRRELKSVARPENAEAMRAYMKCETPFHGCSADAMRSVCKRLFAELSFERGRDWREAVAFLWRNAAFREERYAAVELCAHRCARPFRAELDALPLYEEMIVTGAWWDLVDGIATHRIGDLLRAHPTPMKRTLRRWAKSDDMWKRRAAIIAQTRLRAETDVALLEECIAPSIERKEFWLRKAIGWALRSHAYTDAAWVRAYVAAHPQLSGLSRREALKHAGS